MQQQAVATQGQAPGDVTRKADGRDQHDHQPDLERIQDTIRSERAVWQQWQDDRGQHRELEHRPDVLSGQLLAEPLELGLEVQQHRHADTEGDGQRAITVVVSGAEKEYGNGRDHGGRARVIANRAPVLQVSRDQRARYAHHTGAEHPGGAGRLREKRGQRTQYGDQRERADAGLGRGLALPLEPDQKPDAGAQCERQDQRQRRIHRPTVGAGRRNRLGSRQSPADVQVSDSSRACSRWATSPHSRMESARGGTCARRRLMLALSI